MISSGLAARCIIPHLGEVCKGFLQKSPLSLAFARQLPQRGSHWQAGPLPTGRLRPDMAQEGGPCCKGQRLLDNAPCQAVAGLDSGALLLPRYCASLVQTKAGRHANGSPSGGAGEEQSDETERARPHRSLYLFGETCGIMGLRPCPPILWEGR